MNYHILTLFPDMIEQGLNNSIIGRAIEEEIITVDAVNIRDYTNEKHGKTDDYPYGGGAGMVMQAQPVYDAWRSVADKLDKKPRTVYLTPQGTVFSQNLAKELAVEEDLVFLCGHYEGVDERVIEEIVTDSVSIGDYVVTGGELPAMVMIDAISRMIPGVLHNGESAEDDSFGDGLLEYPQYSRPETWNGNQVPAILISGDHAKVDAWRREQSLMRTADRRPDLLKTAQISPKEREFVSKYLANKKDI
jgi:tRNA (guanine37-N1)-methyltransferase